MALISCPSCEKQVSEQAATCPNCGHPIAEGLVHNPEPQKVVVQLPASKASGSGGCGFGFLLILLVIVGIIAAATKPDEAEIQGAIASKGGIGMGAGFALAKAIGTAKYHDYFLFSTLTDKTLMGTEKTVAIGYFGHVSLFLD
jgi:hypothetical protein